MWKADFSSNSPSPADVRLKKALTAFHSVTTLELYISARAGRVESGPVLSLVVKFQVCVAVQYLFHHRILREKLIMIDVIIMIALRISNKY